MTKIKQIFGKKVSLSLPTANEITMSILGLFN